MQDLMNVVYNRCESISGEAHTLIDYARALSTLGNRELSLALYSIAGHLQCLREDIQDAVSKELDQQYKQSVQNSANVFNAALAGIKVAKGLSDDDLPKAAKGLAGAEV